MIHLSAVCLCEFRGHGDVAHLPLTQIEAAQVGSSAAVWTPSRAFVTSCHPHHLHANASALSYALWCHFYVCTGTTHDHSESKQALI